MGAKFFQLALRAWSLDFDCHRESRIFLFNYLLGWGMHRIALSADLYSLSALVFLGRLFRGGLSGDEFA